MTHIDKISKLLLSAAAMVAACAFMFSVFADPEPAFAVDANGGGQRYILSTVINSEDVVSYYMVDTATGQVYYRTQASNWEWLPSGAQFPPMPVGRQ